MHANSIPSILPREINSQKFPGLTILRPDEDLIEKTKEVAKSIFVEAFTSTYTEYHKQSESKDSIEVWLKLSEGLSVKQWLNQTFDNEFEEYQQGKKAFIYLVNTQEEVLGWLSHSPVSEDGDLYLSQCCLTAKWRNQQVASTAFASIIKAKPDLLSKLFPGIKTVKLIARRINQAAQGLYTKAGFKQDSEIDPKVYGDTYDSRYVGYRLSVETKKT